jgi:hypothetical protein
MVNHKMKPLKDRPNKKRIALDIPVFLYRAIVKVCELRYCSVTSWINRTMLEKIQKEDEYFREKIKKAKKRE